MDYSSIKELIKIIDDSSLTNFELELDGTVVKMSKNQVAMVADEVVKETKSVKKEVAKAVSNSEAAEVKEEVAEKIEGGNLVTAPIVGTFYASSAPGKAPFIKVGDKVKKGDVICIVEAMKIMNEITSEFDGEVVEVFVKEEDMVEYGQPLFRIK
ncbi:MAG: acetyl-CoA carboxylase biotin carboxyl carrier protein [Clostridiaceae bacterium]